MSMNRGASRKNPILLLIRIKRQSQIKLTSSVTCLKLIYFTDVSKVISHTTAHSDAYLPTTFHNYRIPFPYTCCKASDSLFKLGVPHPFNCGYKGISWSILWYLSRDWLPTSPKTAFRSIQVYRTSHLPAAPVTHISKLHITMSFL